MVVVRSDLPDQYYPDHCSVTDWLLDQIADQTERTSLTKFFRTLNRVGAEDTLPIQVVYKDLIHGQRYAPYNIDGMHTYSIEHHFVKINSETDEHFSYSVLRDAVLAVSASLIVHGVQPGDVLCAFAHNTPEYAIFLLATLKVKAIVTGVNPEFTSDELKRQLDDGEVSYIFTQPELLQKVKATGKAFSRLRGVFILGEAPGCVPFSSLCVRHNAVLPPDEVCLDARTTPALLPYSSGTTGLPKGVIISHYNIIANLIQITHTRAPFLRHTGEVVVEFAPFYHVSGLLLGLLNTLLCRGTVVAMPHFDYETYLHLLQKYKATFLKVPPPILLRISKDENLCRYDLTSLRSGSTGSAPIPPEVLLEVSRKLSIPDLTQGWGMSETTVIGTYGHPGLPVKPASVGKLAANTEAKIVDPSTGDDLRLGASGELWLRGPQVMVGYWRKPQETAETVTTDGWLKTGDIAYVDEDHYIFIVDRLKELIKVKGFQVAPAELEAILLSHPAVIDAAVVGVKNEVSGELPRAYVVLRESHVGYVTADNIRKYVKERVVRYKQLNGGVIFVKEIPKSPTGKILRRILRQQTNQLPAKL